MYKKMFQILNTPIFLGVKKLFFYQNSNITPVLQTKLFFHYLYSTLKGRLHYFQKYFSPRKLKFVIAKDLLIELNIY